MKKFLALLLLAAPLLAQTAPPVSIGGSIGITGGQSLRGMSTLTLTGTTYTMVPNEWWAGTLLLTGTPAALVTITAPLNNGQDYNVINLSAQTVTIKGATGNGADVPPYVVSQSVQRVTSDGINYYLQGGGNGSSTATKSALVSTPLGSSSSISIALNKSQAISIQTLGDSYNVVCIDLGTTGPASCNNRYPEILRVLAQAQYGSGGTGMIPLAWYTGSSPLAANSLAYTVTGTYDTTTTALGPFNGGNGTLFHLNSGAVVNFNDNRSIPWDMAHIYGATSAGSGSLVCTRDGGTTYATLTTGSASATGAVSGGFTATRWDLSSIPLTTHTMQCTASGDFYVWAFEGTAGTTGVRIHNTGIGGATMVTWGGSATNNNAFSAIVYGGLTAAVMMGQTNDAGSSVTTFATNLTNIVNALRALTAAPTVLIAIPPVSIVNNTNPLAAYTSAQLGVCGTLTVTCVNTQDRGATVGATTVGWGTTYTANPDLWNTAGPSSPGVHPYDNGGKDLGQQIFAALFAPTDCKVNCKFVGQTIMSQTNAGGGPGSPLSLTSDGTVGTVGCITGTSANVHNWCFQSGLYSSDSQLLFGDFTTGFYAMAINAPAGGTTGYARIHSGMRYCWSSGSAANTNPCDVGFSRLAAKRVSLDTATQGDGLGSLTANYKVSTGNTVASASTISTATGVTEGTDYFIVTGNTTIDTLTPPGGYTSLKGGCINILFTGTPSTTTAGNIAAIYTFTANLPYLACYYNATGTSKWYFMDSAAYVTLTGTQTISGAKTFSSPVTIASAVAAAGAAQATIANTTATAEQRLQFVGTATNYSVISYNGTHATFPNYFALRNDTTGLQVLSYDPSTLNWNVPITNKFIVNSNATRAGLTLSTSTGGDPSTPVAYDVWIGASGRMKYADSTPTIRTLAWTSELTVYTPTDQTVTATGSVSLTAYNNHIDCGGGAAIVLTITSIVTGGTVNVTNTSLTDTCTVSYTAGIGNSSTSTTDVIIAGSSTQYHNNGTVLRKE